MTGNIYKLNNDTTHITEKRNYPSVSIIILNWNGWKDSIECLESLFKISYKNYNVVLVDNNSEIEDITKIREYCGGKLTGKFGSFIISKTNKPIHLLEYNKEISEQGGDPIREKNLADIPSCRKLRLILNEKNYGFAEGNNIAIRYAIKSINPEYIFLLNNDTIVDRYFLDELISNAQKDERIGIVGPMIYYYSDPKKIESLGSRLNLWIGAFNRICADKIDQNECTENIEVDFVSGAALLIKRKVIEEIGLLYSPYFAYWEETDWCSRAKKSGFSIIGIPKAKIWHKISQSVGCYSSFRVYLILRNNIVFMRRNAALRYFPSFILFYFSIRIWVYALGLYRSGNINSLNEIIKIIFKSVKDGVYLEIWWKS